jgi:hypothetical protein
LLHARSIAIDAFGSGGRKTTTHLSTNAGVVIAASAQPMGRSQVTVG